jgi:two-component system phosphate regulon response regulator PhoB
VNHLLLVEDDLSLGQTLSERLERNEYKVTWAKTISEARDKMNEQGFDLLILDVGLPDGSGFDFAKEVKNGDWRFTPFIFMTALASAPQRLEGFELGAEEFIPKPFHLKEILLRVKHVLETHATKNILKLSEKIIDFKSQSIKDLREEKIEYLPSKDFLLLRLLIDSSPQVVSRDEILEKLWGSENFPTNRTVDNVILRIRQLLGNDGQMIRSVRGVGYQWVSTGTTSGTK